jgi:Dna[CI] antecedent, DciA
MMRSSSFLPYRQNASAAGKSANTTKGVADFLRAHDKMGTLWPTVTRLAKLQKDCSATLPVMFDACTVLQLEAGQLVLAVANTALAAKLKQTLPKLQDNLLKLGWQVNAIRIKVQAPRIEEKPRVGKQLSLSQQAISAFAELGQNLEQSPRNSALKAALDAMVQRHRAQK